MFVRDIYSVLEMKIIANDDMNVINLLFFPHY